MAGSPRSVEASVRVYGMLIKAYPASFRREYEGEMTLVLREHLTDVCLVRTAPHEHFLELQRRIAMRSATLAILAAFFAAAGYLIVFAIITYVFMLIPVMAMFASRMDPGQMAMGVFLYPAMFLSGLILERVKPLFRPVIAAQSGAMAILLIWLILVVVKEAWNHGGGIVWGQGIMNLLFFASLFLSAFLGRVVAIKASHRLARFSVPWFQVAGAMAVMIGSLAIACVLRLTQIAYQLAADQADPMLQQAWTFGQFTLLAISAMTIAQLVHLFVKSYRNVNAALPGAFPHGA